MILPGKESQTAQMFYAAIPDTVYYNVNQMPKISRRTMSMLAKKL